MKLIEQENINLNLLYGGKVINMVDNLSFHYQLWLEKDLTLVCKLFDTDKNTSLKQIINIKDRKDLYAKIEKELLIYLKPTEPSEILSLIHENYIYLKENKTHNLDLINKRFISKEPRFISNLILDIFHKSTKYILIRIYPEITISNPENPLPYISLKPFYEYLNLLDFIEEEWNEYRSVVINHQNLEKIIKLK